MRVYGAGWLRGAILGFNSTEASKGSGFLELRFQGLGFRIQGEGLAFIRV